MSQLDLPFDFEFSQLSDVGVLDVELLSAAQLIESKFCTSNLGVQSEFSDISDSQLIHASLNVEVVVG